jgi:hypothetical protein
MEKPILRITLVIPIHPIRSTRVKPNMGEHGAFPLLLLAGQRLRDEARDGFREKAEIRLRADTPCATAERCGIPRVYSVLAVSQP